MHGKACHIMLQYIIMNLQLRTCRDPAKKKFQGFLQATPMPVRKQLKEQCEIALSFMDHYQFTQSRVELCNVDTGEVESVSFDEENQEGDENEEGKEMEETEVHNLNMWVYLKDRFNISNEAWHELAMNAEEPPCLNKLIKYMNKLNTN